VRFFPVTFRPYNCHRPVRTLPKKDKKPAVLPLQIKMITDYMLSLSEIYIENQRMNETQQLIEAIINGIQEKKGKQIVIADLTDIGETICRYFIICQGNSPAQVQAIAESIGDAARLKCQAKPVAVDGMKNAEWVAMDYIDVIVHVFLPQTRSFYDIEHLWADAQLTEIPDLD